MTSMTSSALPRVASPVCRYQATARGAGPVGRRGLHAEVQGGNDSNVGNASAPHAVGSGLTIQVDICSAAEAGLRLGDFLSTGDRAVASLAQDEHRRLRQTGHLLGVPLHVATAVGNGRW